MSLRYEAMKAFSDLHPLYVVVSGEDGRDNIHSFKNGRMLFIE